MAGYPTVVIDGITFIGVEEDALHDHRPHYEFSEGFIPCSAHSLEEIKSLPNFHIDVNQTDDEIIKVLIGTKEELERFSSDLAEAMDW